MANRAFLLKLADDGTPPNYSTLAGMRVCTETHSAAGSVITATGIFLGQAAENTLRRLALAGSRVPMQLAYDDGERQCGDFLVLRLERVGEVNGEKSYAITLSSAALSAPGNWQEIPDPEIGQVQWHCSDEDGGPDVGILLGLSGGKMLWVGEMLDAEGVGTMGLKVYDGQHVCHAMPFDYDSIREVIEQHIAPLIRQTHSGNWQETLNEVQRLEAEKARLRDALIAIATNSTDPTSKVLARAALTERKP